MDKNGKRVSKTEVKNQRNQNQMNIPIKEILICAFIFLALYATKVIKEQEERHEKEIAVRDSIINELLTIDAKQDSIIKEIPDYIPSREVYEKMWK